MAHRRLLYCLHLDPDRHLRGAIFWFSEFTRRALTRPTCAVPLNCFHRLHRRRALPLSAAGQCHSREVVGRFVVHALWPQDLLRSGKAGPRHRQVRRLDRPPCASPGRVAYMNSPVRFATRLLTAPRSALGERVRLVAVRRSKAHRSSPNCIPTLCDGLAGDRVCDRHAPSTTSHINLCAASRHLTIAAYSGT